MKPQNIILIGISINVWCGLIILVAFGIFSIFIGLKGLVKQKPYLIAERFMVLFQILFNGLGMLIAIEVPLTELLLRGYLTMTGIILPAIMIPALIGLTIILWKLNSGYLVIGITANILQEMIPLHQVKIKELGNGLVKISSVDKVEKNLVAIAQVVREQFEHYDGSLYLSASKQYLAIGIVLILLIIIGLIGGSLAFAG